MKLIDIKQMPTGKVKDVYMYMKRKQKQDMILVQWQVWEGREEGRHVSQQDKKEWA